MTADGVYDEAMEPALIDHLSVLSSAILGRHLEDDELAGFRSLVAGSGEETARWMALLSCTGEGVTAALERAYNDHLYLLHRARALAVATLLPPAAHILDLGGANAPLCDMGYPHPFTEVIVVDLPPEDRHEEFAGRVVRAKATPLGPVDILYADMAELSGIGDNTVDLVWSGQSIEHVTLEHGRRVFAEVLRVLRPDGWFCLDTPNRRITALHAGPDHIHPDHKIEYTPEQLVAELTAAGFSVVDSFGICEMPLSAGGSSFDYRDFVIGAAISTSVDTSYVQFHRCRPAQVSRVPEADAVQAEEAAETEGSGLQSANVQRHDTMRRIWSKARRAMRRGRAALAQPTSSDLVELIALVQTSREEHERQISELRSLVLQLHSDAWDAAHVRNVDLDTLAKRLHVDAEETTRRLIDRLHDTMRDIHREIAIDYESTIEALTYVARSLREVSEQLPGPSRPVA
jgi:SAM-dependent methyltransferase